MILRASSSSSSNTMFLTFCNYSGADLLKVLIGTRSPHSCAHLHHCLHTFCFFGNKLLDPVPSRRQCMRITIKGWAIHFQNESYPCLTLISCNKGQKILNFNTQRLGCNVWNMCIKCYARHFSKWTFSTNKVSWLLNNFLS